MKAAQIKEYGHADNIELVEIDTPQIGEGQVLVEVHAASLNPFDTIVREGHVKDMIPSLPVTLGGDIAGTVTEIGEGVDNVVVGDTVFGTAAAVAGNSGALAEYAATKASQLSRKPSNVDFAHAAALPLVGASALQALDEHIGLRAGQKLFIHGGSGGIGSVAVQLAKHRGAHVTASVRGPEAAEYVRGLGADDVIDTETTDISSLTHDFDALFETAGGADFDKTLELLKRGGVAVSMLAQADADKTQELGITATTQSTQVTAERLATLCELVESGAVVPQIGEAFPLDQVQAAFGAREGSKVFGKVVIEVK